MNKVIVIFLLFVVGSLQAFDRVQHASTLEQHIQEAFRKIVDRESGLTLLDEVERVLAVKGPNPKGGCGGLDYNRIYFLMKRPVVEIIGDFRNFPTLRSSGDKAGPHPGFDASFESYTSRPRLQGHYRVTGASEESELEILRQRIGQEAADPLRILEVDLDYDWKHGSNPLCRYKGILPSLIPGLFRGKPAGELFRSRWIERQVVGRFD